MFRFFRLACISNQSVSHLEFPLEIKPRMQLIISIHGGTIRITNSSMRTMKSTHTTRCLNFIFNNTVAYSRHFFSAVASFGCGGFPFDAFLEQILLKIWRTCGFNAQVKIQHKLDVFSCMMAVGWVCWSEGDRHCIRDCCARWWHFHFINFGRNDHAADNNDYLTTNMSKTITIFLLSFSAENSGKKLHLTTQLNRACPKGDYIFFRHTNTHSAFHVKMNNECVLCWWHIHFYQMANSNNVWFLKTNYFVPHSMLSGKRRKLIISW